MTTSAACADPILVHNLRKVYPNGKTAVESLSFSIPSGQCFGLLGENGSGKVRAGEWLRGGGGAVRMYALCVCVRVCGWLRVSAWRRSSTTGAIEVC